MIDLKAFSCLISLWALGHNNTSHLLFPVGRLYLRDAHMGILNVTRETLPIMSAGQEWSPPPSSYWFMIWRATINKEEAQLLFRGNWEGESVLALTEGAGGFLPKTTTSKSWRNGSRPINNLRSYASSVLSQEQILTVPLRVKVKLTSVRSCSACSMRRLDVKFYTPQNTQRSVSSWNTVIIKLWLKHDGYAISNSTQQRDHRE